MNLSTLAWSQMLHHADKGIPPWQLASRSDLVPRLREVLICDRKVKIPHTNPSRSNTLVRRIGATRSDMQNASDYNASCLALELNFNWNEPDTGLGERKHRSVRNSIQE